MGFFHRAFNSIRKSQQIRELQRIIAPPSRTTADVFREAMDFELRSKREDALQRFLRLCEQDDGVAVVMQQHNLTRTDLEEIYKSLMASGAGGWRKGHFVPLSCIAYAEPLLYIVTSRANGVSMLDISSTVLGYWDGAIAQGTLLKALGYGPPK